MSNSALLYCEVSVPISLLVQSTSRAVVHHCNAEMAKNARPTTAAQHRLASELLTAVLDGSIARVRQLTARGADAKVAINTRVPPTLLTPFLACIAGGDPEIGTS